MQISNRTFGLITSVAIGLVMSFFMSFVMLAANAGFIEGFFLIWMKGFGTGFAASIPIGVLTIPLIRKGLMSLFQIQA